MATTIRNQKVNTVLGKVTDVNNMPLPHLKVELYDANLRDWQLLTETLTDRNGAFEMQWQQEQLKGRNKKTADLAFRVLSAVKQEELYKSGTEAIRFNAGKREVFTIVVSKTIPNEVVEFENLVADVSYLAGEVAIASLEESDENKDVTFISRELHQDSAKIAHLIVAHRLEKTTDIEAAFFYGLFYKETLLSNKAGTNLKARTAITINSDDQIILYDIALTDPNKIQRAIEECVKNKIIPSSVLKNLDNYLKIVTQYEREAKIYYEQEHPKKAIDLLTNIINTNKINEIQDIFTKHKDDPLKILSEIADPGLFEPPKSSGQRRKKNIITDLKGFESKVIRTVAASRGLKKTKDLKNLARLNTKEWVDEIKKAKPKLKNKKLIETYAATISRRLEKEYPTIAFAAQLERAEKPLLNNQKKIVSFLNKHDDFRLEKDSVDQYLKNKKIAKKDREAISAELKSVQRVFKLTPSYSKTMALLNEKVHSSYAITAMGSHRFINEVAPKAGIDKIEAENIYAKAESRNTAAMLLIGELQDSMSIIDIASFETKELALKMEAVSDEFPNLKSLFKLTDTCECEHCRSVYSPAAYLVEILQFINDRSVVAGNAKTELFSRRPDLGEIDLSCANANTPVRYIDLVCELLEEQVAPDQGIDFNGVLSDGADPLKGIISGALYDTLILAKLPVTREAEIFETESNVSSATLPHYLRDTKMVCKIVNTGGNNYKVYRLRQTLSSAEELDAAPEYVNYDAYKELNNRSYAFRLPFDLFHAEANAYLKRFDMERASLMQTFRVGANPTNASIAAEKIGLTEKEREIITSRPNPNNNAVQQDFWNVPAPGDTVSYLKKVDQFLDRTGLTYKELDLLLKLPFIDQNDNLFIKHDDLSCDTSKKVIENLDLDVLDRLHRFLRLQKKTGWNHELIEELVSQQNFGKGFLKDTCLIKAAQLMEISEKTMIKMEELVGCFGEIPHRIYDEDAPKPLYHQLFLNKAKNGVIEEALQPEKVDGTQLLSTHKAYIATCLQWKEKDLDLLLPLLSNDDLTFKNLSFLLLISRLSKKLKLKAEEFVELLLLTGIDISSEPDKVLRFIEVVEHFEQSPLDANDVKFILNHEATDLADRVISNEKIEEQLNTLKEAYSVVLETKKSLFDENLTAEEQQENLINTLSVLEGVSEDDVKIILKFLDRDWTDVTDVAGAKTFIDDKFDEKIDRTAINTAIDALDALAPNADSAAEQKALVQAFLDAIADVNITIAKQTELERIIATAFNTDTAITKIVLANTKLKKPGPGAEAISELLTNNFENAITDLNYPKQYGALRLLHKVFPLITAFEFDEDSLEWFLLNNEALTWFAFDNIPYETGQAAVAFATYLNFCRINAYQKELKPVVNPADAENPVTFFNIAAMLETPSNRDAFLTAFSVLSGYEKTDLDDLDAYKFAAFDSTNYRNPENWKFLLECAEVIRTMGTSLDQIKTYLVPKLTQAEVSDLRATLKSRYDEKTWLSTLKEIMDAIRPQKRDALVTYLLATNPDMKDENDLYDYLLVDVKMEACMPSSRIVQAHGSIQLFVQRCMMGLEPDAIADLESDPNWEQWKWMRNYRVWEANRKVFLYPENWYDVTLTDDKSYLLDEFINEIQQNELTNDNAEAAFKKYLEKLDEIAFLEVMATWYDTKEKDMHVFARTKGGDPSIYYYRRFEKERYWTPWEKVELEITGDHLLAFMRNNRLHLAWPIFTEEADPDQGATLPDQSSTAEQPIEKPRKKLKIQLAISEYANNAWQPKRVSHEGILTPGNYTTDSDYFDKKDYNLLFSQYTDHILIVKSRFDDVDYHELNGIFSITGCKGYPELIAEGTAPFPDFYPDFKDAELKAQRYFERPNQPNTQPRVNPDDLSIRNSLSIFLFYKLLNKTPGKFRMTYPHQFTVLDLIALLVQVFISLLLGAVNIIDKRYGFKLPLGTLLPYFKEDSNHSYVIIPGFYKKEGESDVPGTAPTRLLNDSEKRTASDVFKLIEDINKWFKKIQAEFKENPPANNDAAIQFIINDADFQNILIEVSKYEILDFVFNLLLGNTGDDDFDNWIKELKDTEGLVYGEQFKNTYHPLVCKLRSILYKDGVSELMKRDTQISTTNFNFETHYQPSAFVPQTFIKNADGSKTLSYPIEDVDFTSDGSYSVYNWDLFFRVPLHIATTLTKNQRFEEALTWFHYMFNPTGALSGNGVQKYWVTKPFYLNQEADYIAQRIDTLLNAVADSSTPEIKELEFAISEWRSKPFRPDVIMRFRPVAYQKALLMKYIDNLVEWGDYLFRQDTMESLAQATQMYILADKLLGPKPRVVPPVIKQPYETYNQIEAKLDSFGNALIELENILPDFAALPEGGAEIPPPPITLSMLYFCIPGNENMKAYWSTVEDRLFKIRNCQNIDGVERSLALFAPPIDPGMLVKAAASGLDLSSILGGLNAPTPYYRFLTLSQKASELAQEVRTLGNGLLQALEKKDAEAMSLLRSKLEIKVLNAVVDVKKLQIDESKEQIEVLKRTKLVTEERKKYYEQIEKISSKEQLNLDKLSEANDYQFKAQIVKTVAGALRLVPEFHVGASGFGGSPQVVFQLGGSALSTATNIGADILNILGSMASYEAGRAATLGGFNRRFDDWKLQERLAKKEIKSIEKQIAAAEFRKKIAIQDLKNQELQIENAKKSYEFMQSKFTNKELYDWMIGQISSVYFKAYQLTHDFAKKAERCYRFELGNNDSFISFGYWDSMKKGLQSADHLIHDIKRMETAFIDKNKREYEITKHVSLAQLDPIALVSLRASGSCDFEIPEVLYDMDHAGQYFRRIKSVSLSIPCVAGPYTSVSAKLSLVNNRYRKNTNPDNAAATGYAEDPGNDERFVYNVGAIQSIATSSSQNDSGVFELNFRDDRYLPFENTGAISSWRLELPEIAKQFDYKTIADVIIHVKYTAREGGSGLKSAANTALTTQLAAIKQGLEETGLHIGLNIKNDLPQEWHLLKETGALTMTLEESRLPYLVKAFTPAIDNVLLMATVKDNPATYTIDVDGTPVNLSKIDGLGMCKASTSAIALDTSFTLDITDIDDLEELLLIVNYIL
jgi:hypothetical protein